jgi:hypothetical protein
VVVVDEADECMRAYPDATRAVLDAAVTARMDDERPTIAFAGATLSDALCRELADAGWARYAVTAETPAPGGQLPPGLQHRCALWPQGRPALFMPAAAARHL